MSGGLRSLPAVPWGVSLFYANLFYAVILPGKIITR
jgi:hypothetical protein